MLEAIRKHAYSWTTRILLLLLGAVFVIFFGAGGAGYFGEVRPVALINCRKILLFTPPGCQQIMPDQVDQAVQGLKNTVTNVYGPNAAAVLKGMNLQQTALEQLIDETLIKNEAKRFGLTISDQQLEKTIESQEAFQLDGRFDVARYNAILQSNNLEPVAYENETRSQMLTDAVREMIANSVQLSTADARQNFDQYGANIEVAYVAFPATNFTAGIEPTAAAIAKYYDSHKDAFRVPERVKIAYIRYDPAKLTDSSYTPSDADMEDAYEQNLKTLFTHPEQVHAHHILIAVAPGASPQELAAARAKAEKILQELKAGADFSKLAKEYSDDPGTRDKGGDPGFFGRGELMKPFEDAAFSMKPGELQLVQTQYGFHIIRLDEKRPAHVDTPAEARSQIIQGLKQKDAEDLAQQDANQDLTAAETGHPLNELAQKRKLTTVETPFFSQNEPIQGAEGDTTLAKDVFTLQSGEIKTFTNGAAPYLVKLLGREPARIPPLSEIHDTVRAALIQITAADRARASAAAFLKQVKSAADLDQLAAAQHLAVQKTGEFPRISREVPGIGPAPQVTVAAGTLPKLPAMINDVVRSGADAYVVAVLSRTPPSDEEWKTQGPAFTQRLLNQRRVAVWASFINGLKSRANIVVRTDLLHTASDESNS